MPIIQHLVEAYKLWHSYLPHVAKSARYTIGEKINSIFVDIIEFVFTASYLAKEEKLPYIRKSINKLDLVKFFLQIIWEIQALDNKKYIVLSEELNDIGRMLGGWSKNLSIKETPH